MSQVPYRLRYAARHRILEYFRTLTVICPEICVFLSYSVAYNVNYTEIIRINMRHRLNKLLMIFS